MKAKLLMWSRSRGRFGGAEASFLALALLALGLRLWELDGRAIHYDEGIHIHYAWRLATSDGGPGGWPWIFGRDYIHSPWMHGPFQIEFTALILRLFGDTEFTARLGYALLGTALVVLPYFLRDYLGRIGSVLVAAMLAVSPTMLYFSRFGREDMPMLFWTSALFVLMWRYIHDGKHRYLYLASAVLAFLFATKETAYIVVLIFGAMMFLLALPQLVPWALGRSKLSDLVGPAGFLVLLVTLTLPQWSAVSGLAQDALGLTLANPDGVTNGLVGAPQWESPLVTMPVYDAPWWFHSLAVALLLGGVLWISQRDGLRNTSQSNADAGPTTDRRSGVIGFQRLRVAVPLALVAATLLLLFRPIGKELLSTKEALEVDIPIAVAIGIGATGLLVLRHYPWKRGALLVIVPVLLTLLYAALFTPIVNVDTLVNGLLPGGIRVDTSANGIPVNYLVAGGVLAVTFLISIYLGVSWRGGVWLACAAIFYGIWVTLYTTFFTNWAGFFSGIWQGMGYWVAQQDVARGGQPWYYYFVSLSVYELLPLVFGLLGGWYFLKRGEIFGLALAFWSLLTLLAYTVASEKMPWLVVNISLPFIWLAGKYLGELVERVPWRRVLPWEHLALLVLPPLMLVAGVYLLSSYTDQQKGFSGVHWLVMAGMVPLAVVVAYLVRLARPRTGMTLISLGIAGLLLGFGTVIAFRAIYTYDDSRKEILVYAQGSAHLSETFRSLEDRVFRSNPQSGDVEVDYDLWYPFNWYVRHQQKAGTLGFYCFKDKGEEGWYEGCSQLPKSAQAQALLLSANHVRGDSQELERYQRQGPFRNLLWFPETYRRPGENRQTEGIKEELSEDLEFFKAVTTSRDSWHSVLDYMVFRELDREWYQSEYYSYVPR